MHRIKTGYIFVAGILALLNGLMAMGNGAAIRPVRDVSGAVIYQRPGRILMQPDYWADFRGDWFAWSSLFIAVCLFTCCFIRTIRFLYRRFYASQK
jgi:hypothetical protein